MCDTWVALPDVTEFGQLIFAKNSDRPAFDCQPLVYRPRTKWPVGARVAMEYVELPQVAETYAHLGSRPYWSFGYETGLNEHGVVIGNEANFTRPWRAAANRQRGGEDVPRGLTGMDVIRLALERTRTAADAVELMGSLLECHGQFGSGVPTKSHADGSYDNAFIVADRAEAWVLETCGRNWAARRLTRGHTSISNQPTLRTDPDRASAGLQAAAVEAGWWPRDESRPFDYAEAFSDEMTPRQVSHPRLMRARQLLRERAGKIDARWMKRIARDHYEGTFLEGPLFTPADPDLLTLCMHDSPAGFTWGNTATSAVVVQPRTTDEVPVFWWTPGPPCNGCYVPFFVGAASVPAIVSQPGSCYAPDAIIPPNDAKADEYAANSYWWLFRRLMDVTSGGPGHRGPRYSDRNQVVRSKFDAIEARFEKELPDVMAAYAKAGGSNAGTRVLAQFTEKCTASVVATIEELLRTFGASR